jgi:hypothetical protein
MHLQFLISLPSFLSNVISLVVSILLLSAIFELVFNLGIMTSAYLSALSLLLFIAARGISPIAARGISPYYFMDSRFYATSMSIVATSLSCITYALLPTIVGPGSTDDSFSWRLVGFVVAKSIVGACFA